MGKNKNRRPKRGGSKHEQSGFPDPEACKRPDMSGPEIPEPDDTCPAESTRKTAGTEASLCPGGPGKRCGQAVTRQGVECDICKKWYHLKCQNISSSAYRALHRYDCLAWICLTCKADLCVSPPKKEDITQISHQLAQLEKLMKGHIASALDKSQATETEQLKANTMVGKQKELSPSEHHKGQAPSCVDATAITKAAQKLESTLSEHITYIDKLKATQDKTTAAIHAGQAQLERVVEGQQNLVQKVVNSHTDKQLACIGQVSDLCHQISEIVDAKLQEVPHHIRKLETAIEKHDTFQTSEQIEEVCNQVAKMIDNKLSGTTDEASYSLKDKLDHPKYTTQNRLPNKSEHRSEAMQVVDMFDDYLDYEKRKKNVVVFNLPETEGATRSEQSKEDRAAFVSLVKEHLRISAKVENSFRVGKRNPDRPRLLVVSLSSEGEKWEILRQAPLLKDAGLNPRIYINPDLSARERARGKQLRDELARRKAAGESNLIIRQGRITKRDSSGTYFSEQSPQDVDNTKYEKEQNSPSISQESLTTQSCDSQESKHEGARNPEEEPMAQEKSTPEVTKSA